jgi:hypothetical protein
MILRLDFGTVRTILVFFLIFIFIQNDSFQVSEQKNIYYNYASVMLSEICLRCLEQVTKKAFRYVHLCHK